MACTLIGTGPAALTSSGSSIASTSGKMTSPPSPSLVELDVPIWPGLPPSVLPAAVISPAASRLSINEKVRRSSDRTLAPWPLLKQTMQRFHGFLNLLILAPLALASISLACDEAPGDDSPSTASPVLDESWEAVDLGLWQKITDEGAKIRNAYGEEGKRSFCNEALQMDFESLFASNFESREALENFCNDDTDPTNGIDSFAQEIEVVASTCSSTLGATCECEGGCSSGFSRCRCLPSIPTGV